jgi:hypothetical protein
MRLATSSLLSVVFGTCDGMGHASPPPPEPSSMGQWEPSIVGDTAASEPPQEGRPCLGPLDTWLYRSPPEWRGDSIMARHVVAPGPSLALERGKSYGHMVALEPSQCRRRVSEPRDTWQHATACLVTGLNLEHVCGVLGLLGTDSGPRSHLRGGSELVGGANIFLPTHLL